MFNYWRALMGAVLLSFLVLLGACETAGVNEDGQASATGAGDRGEETAALTPDPSIDDDPEQLLGKDPDQVEDLLGAPELVRRESPAQIWQYRGRSCIFDVVLYDEANGERVTYVEARDRNGGQTEARSCLNQLLRARLEAAAG